MKDKVVLITGSASGIGQSIKQTFINEGAIVCGIDIIEGEYYKGDISSKEVLEDYVAKVINDYGNVDVLVNNALPLYKGIDDCSYEEFELALKVGVTAPFYLSKLLKDNFNEGGSIINISSTRQFQSQAQSESYSASKGAIGSLTHSLAMSLQGRVRVNAISPGWIDTSNSDLSTSDKDQHPVKRVGLPSDISECVLFLCSDKASFINGQNIIVDGGMSVKMIYHNDEGWTYDD